MVKFWVRMSVCIALFAGVWGCDEPADACTEEGQPTNGIEGVVMTPNCDAGVSGATVEARDGGGNILVMTTDTKGAFYLTPSQLPAYEDKNCAVAEGSPCRRFVVSVKKGPFNAGPTNLTLRDGVGEFLVFRIGDGG